MNVYLDASFLVSLYSTDVNSSTAVGTLQSSDAMLIISELAGLEVANALELRVFRKEITAEQATTSWRNLAKDLDSGVFQLRPMPEGSFVRATQIARQTTARLGTRTADLLHVTAALAMDCERLYSFDDRQRKLAHEMKLKLNSLA